MPLLVNLASHRNSTSRFFVNYLAYTTAKPPNIASCPNPCWCWQLCALSADYDTTLYSTAPLRCIRSVNGTERKQLLPKKCQQQTLLQIFMLTCWFRTDAVGATRSNTQCYMVAHNGTETVRTHCATEEPFKVVVCYPDTT